MQTVEQLTKLRIDHYGEIGFGGFADLVDAVGGVNICIDKNPNDPKAGLKLKKGCHGLNGKQALGLVRTAPSQRRPRTRGQSAQIPVRADGQGDQSVGRAQSVPARSVRERCGQLADRRQERSHLESGRPGDGLRGNPITTTTPNAGAQVTEEGIHSSLVPTRKNSSTTYGKVNPSPTP